MAKVSTALWEDVIFELLAALIAYDQNLIAQFDSFLPSKSANCMVSLNLLAPGRTRHHTLHRFPNTPWIEERWGSWVHPVYNKTTERLQSPLGGG